MLWLCTLRGPVRDALALLDRPDVLSEHQMVNGVQDAMDIAAGGPDKYPHLTDSPQTRAVGKV
jgi:hypothetical protein